jgi:hypothetical protein
MMRSPRGVVLGIGLAVSALVVAVVLGALFFARKPAVDLSAGDPLRVAAAVSPRTPLFADTVTARIEIAADTHRIEPESVRVVSRFAPFADVASPVVERRKAPGAEFVSWSVALRCLDDTCRPRNTAKRATFPPASVTYTTRGTDGATSRSVKVAFPPLVFYSRVDQDEVRALNPLSQPPWRAELASLPGVTYRASPTLVAALLFAAGGILVACGLGLLVLALLRKMGALPEGRSRIVGPLERALELLETVPEDDDAVAPRREALELVAAELDRRDERELELSARRLAWSEEPPELEDTRALAQSVRRVLAAGELTSGNGSDETGVADAGVAAAADGAPAGGPGRGSNGRDG